MIPPRVAVPRFFITRCIIPSVNLSLKTVLNIDLSIGASLERLAPAATMLILAKKTKLVTIGFETKN